MKNSKTLKREDLKKWFNSIHQENDMYYMSLLAMSLFSNKKRYSNISELPIILDKDSFMNLLSVYGGQQINIPTKQEVLNYIQSLYYVYYSEVEGLSHNMILKNLCINQESFHELPIGSIRKLMQDITSVSGDEK